MAAHAQLPQQTDPLGLQTFALSESAYDILNRLEGLYSRLIDLEMKKAHPNEQEIELWKEASYCILDAYQNLDWSNFDTVKQFIDQSRKEWHTLQVLEKERAIPVSYLHDL